MSRAERIMQLEAALRRKIKKYTLEFNQAGRTIAIVSPNGDYFLHLDPTKRNEENLPKLLNILNSKESE